MAIKENIKNLSVLLNALNQDYLSKTDFTDAFDAVVGAVNELREELRESVSQTNTALTAEVRGQMNMMLRRLEDAVAKAERMTSETRESSRSDSRLTQKMFEEKVAEMAAMVEPYDDSTLRGMIEEMHEHMKSMKMPKEFDPTEIVKAIKEIRKDIEELKKPRGSVSGGVTDMRIRQAFKNILHTEAPVGDIDGVNLTYTVKNDIFAVVAFSLNGEVIAEIPNYTVAGKTITFSSALPAAYSGKDFEIRYIG